MRFKQKFRPFKQKFRQNVIGAGLKTDVIFELLPCVKLTAKVGGANSTKF